MNIGQRSPGLVPAYNWLYDATAPSLRLQPGARSYGVGAGDSPGDGEGISVADPSVFGGFLCAVPPVVL